MSKKNKELAFIGLGKMGSAMSAHLAEKGYTVHGYDKSADTRNSIKANGVLIYASLKNCIKALPKQKTIWLMVPARHVDSAIADIMPLLNPGDCIIDGGNSFFKDSIFRHQDLEDNQIDFIDCGTSGGVEGARNGASLMVGGDKEAVEKLQYLFKDLAEPNGFGYVGGPGAGHFVKMVHNGIEYGMIGAIAEGINALHEHKEGMHLNIDEAIKAYEHGSIIESNLMSWLSDAYEEKAKLKNISGKVPKGETEMEMEYLVSNNKLPVLNAALIQRKLTRTEPSYIGTLIAAIRNEFGGHKTINKKSKK